MGGPCHPRPDQARARPAGRQSPAATDPPPTRSYRPYPAQTPHPPTATNPHKPPAHTPQAPTASPPPTNHPAAQYSATRPHRPRRRMLLQLRQRHRWNPGLRQRYGLQLRTRVYLYNTPTRSKPGLHRRLDINSAIILRSRRKLSRHKTRKPGIVKRHIGRRRRRPRLGIPITIIYIAGSYTQSTTNDDRPHNRHPPRHRRNHSRTRNHLTGDLHDRHRRLFHHRGHRTNPAGTHLEVPHTLPEKIPGRKMARRVVGGQWVGVAVHIPVRRDPRRQRQTHTVPRDKPTGPRGVPAGLRTHLRRRRIRPRPLKPDPHIRTTRGGRNAERVEHLLIGQPGAIRGERRHHIPVGVGQRRPRPTRRPQADQIPIRIPGVGRGAVRDRLLLDPGVAQRGAVTDREPIQPVITVRRRPRRTVRHQPIKPVKARAWAQPWVDAPPSSVVNTQRSQPARSPSSTQHKRPSSFRRAPDPWATRVVDCKT